MIVCFNKYGRFLSCGEIVNYIYLPFNEYCGYRMTIVFPLKTGNLDYIVGIDREENIYFDIVGTIEYCSDGSLYRINSQTVGYNGLLIYTIGNTKIINLTLGCKFKSIGNVSIEHTHVIKANDNLVSKIGNKSITYNMNSDDVSYSEAGSVHTFGDVLFDYESNGKLYRVNGKSIGFYDQAYDREGCGDLLYGRCMWLNDDVYIKYQLGGLNAGRPIKIGNYSITYYVDTVDYGLPKTYKNRTIEYDKYRPSSIS